MPLLHGRHRSPPSRDAESNWKETSGIPLASVHVPYVGIKHAMVTAPAPLIIASKTRNDERASHQTFLGLVQMNR